MRELGISSVAAAQMLTMEAAGAPHMAGNRLTSLYRAGVGLGVGSSWQTLQ